MYSSRAPWRLCMKVGSQQASILRKLLLSRRRVSWQRRVASGCNCCSQKKCLPISPGCVPSGMLRLQQLRALQDSEAQSLEALQRELQDQERKAELFNSRREHPRMSVEPATLQSLQRQVSDRDRKIEELTSQLEALKRIDQEMRGKTRPIKPPSNVFSPQQPESSKP